MGMKTHPLVYAQVLLGAQKTLRSGGASPALQGRTKEPVEVVLAFVRETEFKTRTLPKARRMRHPGKNGRKRQGGLAFGGEGERSGAGQVGITGGEGG